ncbi:MAG: glycosyltransferase [Promethearchaeota archaeon]
MNIGFLQVYNEVNWVSYSIDLARKICDKLIIMEGSQFSEFNEIPIHSNDGTLDIIKEKSEEYPNFIELQETIRKYKNYRQNQAANFNYVLKKKCKLGDYLLPLDADDFYFDSYIKRIIEITEDAKVDYLRASGRNFAFSFNWIILFENNEYYYPQVAFKKNKKLIFKPTHQPINYGPNYVFDAELNCLNHYKWVKPTERMYIRHLTSNFYDNMLIWFNENWKKIKLIENTKIPFYGGFFYLQKYNGSHPEILNNHPWRYIDDLRNLD